MEKKKLIKTMKSVRYHYSGFVLARKGRQPELSGWSSSRSAVLRHCSVGAAAPLRCAVRCHLYVSLAAAVLSTEF